jgi:6-phosphogluconolactonase/glucosamine-6-phosphate isomerase/deaminase
MQVWIVNEGSEEKDTLTMSKLAADVFSGHLETNPYSFILMPTGRTPLGMKQIVASRYLNGKAYSHKSEKHVSEATYPATVSCANNMLAGHFDEYYPCSPNSKDSFNRETRTGFLDKLYLRRKPLLIDGTKRKTSQEEEELGRGIEEFVKNAGGADLGVYGLGPESERMKFYHGKKVGGHVMFAYPGTSFDSRTGIWDMPSYMKDVNGVPYERCISMGIATALENKKMMGLVNSANKDLSLYNSIMGPVSEDAPASSFRMKEKSLWIVTQGPAKKILEDRYAIVIPEKDKWSIVDESTGHDMDFIMGGYEDLLGMVPGFVSGKPTLREPIKV